MQDGSFGKKSESKQLIPESKLTQIISKSDATDIVKNLNTIKDKTNETYKSFDEYFAILKKEGQQCVVDYVKENQNQVYVTDDVIEASKKARAEQIAYNETIRQSTLAFKAASIAKRILATIGNMAAMWALSKAISVVTDTIGELVKSEENLRQSANDLGSELSSNSSDIEDYKKKIGELKSIINNSSSSFNEVSQARADLMVIQDELIEKFGTEKGAIESITGAINGQTDALDELSKRSYFQAKNQFNEKTGGDKVSDWLSFGSINDDRIQSNMDKMVHSMRYSFYELKSTGNEVLDSLIAKSYGLNLADDLYGDGKHFQVYGTLDEIQDKLYGIQELSQGFDLSAEFENSFTTISNDVDDALTKFKNLYNQYVLYEKILTDNPDNQYDEQFNLINKAKEAYNEAVKSGDEENIKTSADEYAKTLQSAIDLAMDNYDNDVADYFKSMYPELQQMFGEWQFSLNFETSTDGLQDKVANALDSIDGMSDGTTSFSTGDIENFNPNIATQEQIDAYGELMNAAGAYGLTVKQLISLLQKMGLIQSESHQQLVDTFGQENVNKLSPEDLKIAYTIENAGNMTFDQLQTEIQKNKNSADEAVAKINQLADKSNQLSSMSGQISKMSAALSAKKKNGFVDTDALSGFDTEVRSLESWNTFQETLGSTTSSYSECQEAANALATEWVNSSDFLNQLTEGNREYYETQLESMGIANAEEIVMQSLADAKANAFLASYDLANATDDEVIAMLNEAESAGITSDMIFKLVAEEQIFNAQGLSTEEKVAQLKKLADTYGQTAVAAKIARMEEEYTKSHQPINYEEIAKAASAEINNAVNSVHVDFKGVGNGRKSSGGSGSSKLQTERDTTKEYNWIEQAIENVEKEIKTLDETASSSYASLSRKNEALTNEIGKVTEEIELQQKAYEEYMRKADSIGLPDSYKELVQNGAAGIEDIKDEKLQEQIDGYQKWYEKAQNASDAIRELNTDLKDLRVKSYKLQAETLKDRLDSESITEKQYLAELKAAYEQFYGNLSEYAEQYHEAKLEYLKEEKKYLSSVANAATSVLDTEIDRIREDAEKQEEQLKTQAELLEARKKPLQEELEALDEKVQKENLALNLQKAQYDLARAENQRTKLVYTADKGMIYTSDSTAIWDARKGLDDAKSEIHKQSIQDQIDALDDEISRYDDLIDQINKAADAQVKALEQFKSKWQEVIDVQEQAKNITILTGEFGDDAVSKILSGKDNDLLAQWKESYLDTLKSIDLESQGYIGEMTKQVESFYQHSIKALSDAAGKAADAADAAAARNNLNLLDHPITLENGTVLTPLQPGGRGYDLLLKTKPLTDKIMRGEMDIFSNAVFEGQRQMAQWVKTINYSNIINHVANNVTNNRNAQPNINIGDIYVSCPGVTEQQVARHIGPALVRELNREFQGLHVYADQVSRDKTF